MSRTPALLALLVLAACGGAIDSGPDGSGGGSSATGGGDGQSCASGADTWATFGAGFFGAQCGACHHFTHPDVQEQREVIAGAISTSWMPQDRALAPGARTRVLAYLACGAP